MEELDPAWSDAIWLFWDKQGLVSGAPSGRFLPPSVFARLLRNFVHEQHVSRIGTIDSFMAQMVKAFPIELGLEGMMSVMDDYEAGQQQRAAADELLASADNPDLARTLIEEFRLATLGKDSKRFCDNLDEFVKNKYEIYLQHPEAAKWGDPAMIWGASGMPFHKRGELNDYADLIESQIIASLPEDDVRRAPSAWPAVADFVRRFNGSFSKAPSPLDNILAVWDGTATIPEFKCNRKPTVLEPADAKLISDCMETLVHIALSIRCSRTQGIYRLMKRLDGVYARNTRQRGRLTFADIPRMIAQLGEVSRLNLEYRFDGELKHWALDEFQDTSCEQWEAIRNLVDEAKCDGERSVFVVGDMKQAIYGWRGGDVEIFEREAASVCYKPRDLSLSRRYCKEIADFVNEVFGGEKIADYLRGGEAEAAGKKWRGLWLEHKSAVETMGCVTVTGVRKEERGVEKAWEPFVEPLCADLLRVRPWERGLSSALLVSKNEYGEELADALNKAGIPVTWEGESDLADTPVVQAFLNLLRFAEHPDDTQAWAHLCASPILAAKPFADLLAATDGRDPKERVIAKVTADVSRQGLAGTLRAYADAIHVASDEFTRCRIDGLVRAASEFASVANAEMSLTDFADYVASYKTRAAADTSVVKVLTVHRSKGLGFDYVLVPVIDTQAITVLNNKRTFHSPDWAWLLDQPPAGAAIEHDATLSAANRAEIESSVFEDLCGYYVSMTRAKRALSVFLRKGADKESKDKEKDFNFSNHVARALGRPLTLVLGDSDWYKGAHPAPPQPVGAAMPASARRPRATVRRASPSKLGHASVSASTLFEVKESGAAERGSRLHALLSQIEWLDDSAAVREALAACMEVGIDLERPSAFREALVRPPDVVEVWRERSFELLADGMWTSGTFDRVVFRRQAETLTATIYDFKSNRKFEGESDAAFEKRMKETYAPQMTAYRQAVAQLTGLAAARVSAALLLTETLECVPMG